MRFPVAAASARSTAIVLVALALVVGACTRPEEADPSSTTNPVPNETSSGDASASTTTRAPEDPELSEPLPVDPAVRITTLDNGLTYYIRENDSPGGRAELRLVVNAGSVNEDADQSGVAHFLEHMMFNGTERFPENELTRVLESFGPRFGPDINAFTSFDETVYRLSVPSDDFTIVELGLDVLAEWASKATIFQADVEGERGVVLEEWRVRDQGSGGRISNVFSDLLISGTSYEGRLPIGEPEAISEMNADLLRRFYEDWYRPDLMAIVAVGDFDADDMESLIIDRFASLAPPGDPRDPPTRELAPRSAASAASLADPETPAAFAQVTYPTPVEPLGVVADVRNNTAVELAFRIIENRIRDDVLRGDVPFYGGSVTGFEFTRSIAAVAIAVDADPPELDRAIEALLAELERAERFGFTEAEFERAARSVRAETRQRLDARGSTQDGTFADLYVDSFLRPAVPVSDEDFVTVVIASLDGLSLAEIEQAYREVVESVPPAILVVGPDSPAGVVPTSEEILAVAARIPDIDIAPRPNLDALTDRLMERPEPAEIVSRTDVTPFGYTIAQFANGVTVYLWQTEIAENSLTFQASSLGGTSLLSVDQVADAGLIQGVVARSGVGALDQVEVERLLTDRLVQVVPFISEITEGFFGNASTNDLETMLQLVNLYMTAPRADAAAVEAALSEARPFSEAPETVPALAASVALTDAYYDGDPRYFAVTPVEELEAFVAEEGLAIFRDRFANAADFSFALVGDFDVDVAVDLAASYLGTLPSSDDRENFVDHQPFPSEGIDLRIVEAGQDPQGVLQMAFTAPIDGDVTVEVTAQLLSLVANSMLRDRIREELSASYSPFASIDVQYEPDPFIESFVEVAGDPGELEAISVEVLATLDELAANGPNSERLDTAREQFQRDIELVSNGFLASQLIFYALHPDQDIDDLRRRSRVADSISSAELAELARIAFPVDRRIEIRLVPVSR